MLEYRGKWIGWWVITTADGHYWAAERYENDSLLHFAASAIIQFGTNIRITIE